jgi:hypothetical protein
MKIPYQHNWSQTNAGDLSGALHSTFAVTFEDYGKVTGAKRPFALFTSAETSNFGYPLAIDYFNNTYVILTDDEIFTGDLGGGSFTQLVWPPATGLNSDALVCYGLYTITTDTKVYTWDGGTLSGDWDDRGGSLTSGVPHPMCEFESQPTYKLAVGNANSVYLFDSSYNKSSTQLNLPVEQRVQTIAYRNGNLYVGTRHMNGGEGKIYTWNGNGNAAQYEAPVGCEWVFSLIPYGQTVFAVVSSGQTGTVSGSQFYTEDFAPFPVYYRPDLIWQDNTGLQLNGKVFHRAMKVVGDRVFINIDGSTTSGYLPEMPSGLWVFDPRVGLHHLAPLSAEKFIKDTSLSVSDSVITTSAAHSLKDGDAVQFTTIGGLSGVAANVIYYVKVLSSTTIKLAKSRRSLANAAYLTITGTPTGTDALIYMPNADRGDAYNNTSGPVSLIVASESIEPVWAGKVLFGGRVQNIDGTTRYVLNALSSSWDINRYEFQRLYSENLKDTWQEFNAFIDGLQLDNEAYILKYRVNEKKETRVMQGVWASSNSIRSVLTTQTEDAWDDIADGDEVVIVDGYGRGYSAHVDRPIDTSAETYTLTLDEAIGTFNEDVKFYVTNYRKYAAATDQEDDAVLVRSSIDEEGGWVQIKVETRGFEIACAINDFIHAAAE